MALMIALSSAVSGLKSQQTALDVIANNIANVNTTAYKAQTVTFSDLLSQTISSASAPTATTGGVNPSQVGLGTQVASTTTDMSVGSTSTTSNSTDVALNGAGYFVVQTTTAGEHQYTRAGNLTVDATGNLNIDGYEVCGWEKYTLDADGNKVYDTTAAIEPMNVYSDSYAGNKQVMAAKTTTAADVSGNLNPKSEVVSGATIQNIGDTANISEWDASTTMDVIDEQGNKTEVTIKMKKCATENSTTSWYWEASAADTAISPSSGYIAFDSDGKMVTSFTPLAAAVTSNTSTASPAETTFTSAIAAAGTAVDTELTAYTAALTSGVAADIVSTKAALDTAITTAGGAYATALTAYNTASGTAVNTAAAAVATPLAAAVTATAAGSTFSDAITALNTAHTDAALVNAFSDYTTALTSGDVNDIVSTKTALDTALAAYDTANSTTTAAAALTAYNTTAGTALNTAATALVNAVTNATTATTGYSASDISLTTGLTAGSYTVAVAASTTSTGTYNITLTDPNGKTYTTTSADGSATFTTSSGTITLAAPTTIAAGTMSFSVTEGTAVTFDSSPLVTVTSTTNGTNGVPVEMDLSGITSTGTTSSLSVDEDGYEAGTRTGSYSIGTDGTIYASYSNGLNQSVGQIALAVFNNPSGLLKTGSNLYATTTNSGDYNIVVAGENGSGTMTSYALELSNVDLASQFSNMMVSQRAYQANSKIISTADDMLQSLINMVG